MLVVKATTELRNFSLAHSGHGILVKRRVNTIGRRDETPAIYLPQLCYVVGKSVLSGSQVERLVGPGIDDGISSTVKACLLPSIQPL